MDPQTAYDAAKQMETWIGPTGVWEPASPYLEFWTDFDSEIQAAGEMYIFQHNIDAVLATRRREYKKAKKSSAATRKMEEESVMAIELLWLAHQQQS